MHIIWLPIQYDKLKINHRKSLYGWYEVGTLKTF